MADQEDSQSEELKVGKKLTEDAVDPEQVERLKRNGIIVGILAVILLGGVGYYYYSTTKAEERSKEAAMAMSKIMPQFEQGNYEAALNGAKTEWGAETDGLLYIANEYSGTSEGLLAALYVGNSYMNLERYDEAMPYFNDALDSESDIVKVGAYSGIGYCEEESGNYSAAAENYLKASELATQETLKQRYMYFAALNFEESGNTDKANELYQKVIDINETSEFADLSKSSRARLGIKID